METDKMSTASSVAAERRPLLQALIIERRLLFACTVLVGLSTFLWITAVCTSKWVHVEGGTGILFVTRGSSVYFMSSDAGVWEICRYEFQPNATKATVRLNATVSARDCTAVGTEAGQCYTICTNYLAQPLEVKFRDPAYHTEIPNLVRTMTSFGIIGLFVMAMGCCFSLYTFTNPRYMFKRLAAGIHFISTSCTFVVVQVMTTTVDVLKKNVPAIYPPKDAYHYYHISFYLAVFVVLVNGCAAVFFLWYSRKRKGNKAATDDLAMADEPTIIGR